MIDIEKINKHYEHSKEERPNFCDILSGYSKLYTKQQLEYHQTGLLAERVQGRIESNRIFLCEFFKIYNAIANNDTDTAVDGCYDAIAFLFRMVDVLEGRQKFGSQADEKAR